MSRKIILLKHQDKNVKIALFICAESALLITCLKYEKISSCWEDDQNMINEYTYGGIEVTSYTYGSMEVTSYTYGSMEVTSDLYISFTFSIYTSHIFEENLKKYC